MNFYYCRFYFWKCVLGSITWFFPVMPWFVKMQVYKLISSDINVIFIHINLFRKKVYTTFYSLTINDEDADDFLPNKPSSPDIKQALTDSGLSWCDCKSKRKFRKYLKNTASEVRQKLPEIKSAINKAWHNKNKGKGNCFLVICAVS